MKKSNNDKATISCNKSSAKSHQFKANNNVSDFQSAADKKSQSRATKSILDKASQLGW